VTTTSVATGGPGAPAVRRWETPRAAAGLAYSRTGDGEPVVLLHGQGLSRRSWTPVIRRLAAERDVIAVDLPGHGESPLRPDRDSPAGMALGVASLLDQLGLDSVHVAGNSLGGWVALELGKLRRARTITALSPAGLWRRQAPVYVRAAMRQARINSRIVHRLSPGAPRSRPVRALFLVQASGHPAKVPYDVARAAVQDVATAPGFREALRGLERRDFRDGAAIDVPVTVAFGTRDRVLLPRVARRRDQLPAQTRWVKLAGCGHLPMFDDADAVATLILQSSRPATAASLGQASPADGA
jgi:pimeloyl-ACP methyl ester carboxylesterase